MINGVFVQTFDGEAACERMEQDVAPPRIAAAVDAPEEPAQESARYVHSVDEDHAIADDTLEFPEHRLQLSVGEVVTERETERHVDAPIAERQLRGVADHGPPAYLQRTAVELQGIAVNPDIAGSPRQDRQSEAGPSAEIKDEFVVGIGQQRAQPRMRVSDPTRDLNSVVEAGPADDSRERSREAERILAPVFGV